MKSTTHRIPSLGQSFWLVFVLLALFAIFVQPAHAATITVNPSVTHQTMTGWEIVDFNAMNCVDAVDNCPPVPLAKSIQNQVFDRAVNEIGINRIRLELASGAENPTDTFNNGIGNGCWYSTTNDNNDPNNLNMAGFNFTWLDFKIEDIVLPLRQRAQIRGEQLYVNLNYVSFMQGSECVGMPYAHTNPQEYAELMLATFTHMQQKYGFVPDSIEVILEPDNTQFWRGAQIGNAIVATAQKLQANGFVVPQFIAPSVTNAANTLPFFDEMATQVPAAVPYLSEISYHRYSGISDSTLQAIASRAVQRGKNVSMLECWSNVGCPLSYQELHKDVKLARNSAWQQNVIAGYTSARWALLEINPANMNNPVITVAQDTRYTRHYFEFVRRNAVRVDAQSSSSTTDPLAFRNANGRYVVVAIVNTAGSLNVDGLPAGTYGVKYTSLSNSAQNASAPDVMISSGQQLVTSLPYTAVVTIYGKTTVPVTNQAPIASAGADQTITLPATASLSGSATDDGLPAGSVLTRTWSKASGPGTVTFSNANAQSTTASFSVSGAYTLRLSASDGTLTTTDDVTITVNAAPIVDTVLPVVSLTTPAIGASVSGVITVAATATDNVAVAGVQFLIDGAALGAEDAASPYSVSWTTTSTANGARTLSARARDTSGNTATSAITVTVSNVATDTIAPTVSITSPINGASVSGMVTITATAVDNVGVGGVQFLIDGIALGAEDTTAPYSTTWTTTGATAGSHTMSARARDTSSNSATATATVTVASTPPPTTGNNTITITERSGQSQTNYPVQIGRPFVQGEVPSGQWPQAVVNGQSLPTQVDVKQRWSDGSLKHAILSFVLPSLSASSTVSINIAKSSTQSVSNTPLSQSEMLGSNFNFDAVTQVGSQSASARAILQSGSYTYWTSGPIATTIILADHTNKAYDIGANGAFRPIFHATFWPSSNKVRVRFIGENADTEKSQDQTYALILRTGSSPQTQVYSKSTVTHYANSRWTKEYWIGGNSDVSINHNLAYLIATKFVPNYDTSKNPASAVSSSCSAWTSAAKDLYDAGNWAKAQGQGGARDDIGPYPTWTVQWLYTGDNCLESKTLGNADLSAAWPIHFREGKAGKTGGTGFGKPISIVNRPSLWLGNFAYSVITPADNIFPTGTRTNGGWEPDIAHEADPSSIIYTLTGDYWHLEEMQFWVSYNSAANPANQWNRGPTGSEGVFNQDQVRGGAWHLRALAETLFITPDGSPEKAYFAGLMNDGIAAEEGIRNITGTSFQGNAVWNYGRNTLAPNWVMPNSFGLPPLRQWRRGQPEFAQVGYGINQAVTSEAVSLFEIDYMMYSLGRAKELGYPTGALLSWSAPVYVNILTNPAMNPYIISAGRLPTVKSNGQYFTSWAELKTGYTVEWQNAVNFDPSPNLGTWPADPPEGYAALALTATSMIASEPGGGAAWNWVSTNVLPSSSFNANPKWAILPRSITSTPPPPQDTTPPTVTMTAPANGASVTGVVTISATAADNVGVAGVQFLVDGAALGAEDTTSPYSISWTSTSTTNGAHTLSARARDTNGNTATSTITVTVITVTDTVAPTVSIIAPANGASVSGTVIITASAADNVGVAGVQFFLNGAALGTEDTTAPYSASWVTTSVANGSYALAARARDLSNNNATSSTISVVVANAPVVSPNTSNISGLVGYWRFDENSGSSAADSSGNSNLGTVSGATWMTGKFGSGLQFNGNTAVVTIPSTMSLNPTSSVTIAAWVKPTAWSNNWGDAIVNKEGMYALRSGDSATTQFDLLWWQGGVIRVVRTTPPSMGQWHHVVGVVSNNDASQLYIDGQLVASAPMSWVSDARVTTSPLTIGNSGDPGFNGVIDEVRVYNRALNAQEVAALALWQPTTIPTQNPGDPTGDKVVDIRDVTLIANDFGKTSGYNPLCDQNSDGTINVLDIMVVIANLGKTYP